jgi:hypothetical protein
MVARVAHPESLAMAVLGLSSEDYVIGARLAPMLGRRRTG